MNRKGKKRTVPVILILLEVFIMFGPLGCSKNKYYIDYCGEKSSYSGAKSSYKAGEEVRLYYKNFRTDTEYSFYLDGEYLPLEFDTKGALIRFVMPEHDVKLECEAGSSMSGGAAGR